MVIFYSIISLSIIAWYTFINTHSPTSIICLSIGIVLIETAVSMFDYFTLFTSFQNNKLFLYYAGQFIC